MDDIFKTIKFWLRCLEAELIFLLHGKEIEALTSILRKANRKRKP
jgi:hypothetical protein